MNLKNKLTSIVVSLLILTGCAVTNPTSYISYTQTRQENDKFVSAVYHYNFKNKPEFEYNSGYPLGVYDKANLETVNNAIFIKQ